MRNFLVMLALGLGITFTANAQQGKDKGDGLTSDQKIEKRVQKMASELDLSDDQVHKIKPIIKEQVLEREARKKKHEEMKASGEKASKDKTKKAKKGKGEFKNKMKEILTPEQFEKFEAMKKKKGKKGKKGRKDCDTSCE